MAKLSLAEHMMEQPADGGGEDVGPFVTISRQFGCYGFSLGLLLLEILNDQAEEGDVWKIYQREILERLATETNMAADIIDRERKSRPGMVTDLFRSLRREKVPSGYEIRNRITTIIRGLAAEGHAIIVGQAGASATHDLPNGLWVRLEAPEEWTAREVALREGLTEAQARKRVREMEKERESLRKIYAKRLSRTPAYHLIYDCSAFTLAQIAKHIVAAINMRVLV